MVVHCKPVGRLTIDWTTTTNDGGARRDPLQLKGNQLPSED